MRYMNIGTGKRISKIGLGTHQFGSPDWDYGDRYARQEACAIVRRALELGVTLIDTSEIYGFEASRIARRAVVEGVALSDVARISGFGRGEQILGHALDDMRESAFLATKFYPVNPVRAGAPLFLPQNLERVRDLIATLREVADAHSATPAQVALAWVIRHSAVAAIPGASSVEQLESNVAAAEIDVTDDEYRALQQASAQFHPIPGPGFVSRQISHFWVGARGNLPLRS